MSNYYVHRNHDYDDELAHAFGFRKIGSQKPGHKYYAREGSPGHYLYFYSPAEYAAYKAGRTIKKGAAKVAGKATGVGKAAYSVVRTGAGRVAGGARSLATRAGNTARALPGNARAAAGRAGSLATSVGKTIRALPGNARSVAGRAKEGVLDAGGNAVRALRGGAKAVGRTARRGVNAVNNASGNADRERANRLQAYAERQRIRAMNKEPASAERTKAFDQYYSAAKAARGAKKTYDNSLMGRAESAAKKVGGAANRAANAIADATGYSARKKAKSAPARSIQKNRAEKQYSKTPMGRIENTAKSAGRAITSAPGKAKSAASSAAGTVRKTARKAGTAVANATGYSEKQRAKRLESYANRSQQRYEQSRRDYDGSNKSLRTLLNRQATANDAQYAARNARNSYNHTLMGRAERSAKKNTYAVREAARRVSGAANQAVNTVRDWTKKKKKKGTYT